MELQTATDEITLLYSVSQKLTQASTPIEQLEAVSEYARCMGADSGALIYFHDDGDEQEIVAEWANSGIVPMGIGTRIRIAHLGFAGYWLARPDEPTLVNDVSTDPRLDAETQSLMLRFGIHAAAILPLQSKGSWSGIILFRWHSANVFDERDLRIYRVMQQQASSVVAARRLLEQIERRAADLEIATEEMNRLYDASNRLVRAVTPAELLEAVSWCPQADGAAAGALFYFENFEPHWLELVAYWSDSEDRTIPLGYRIDASTRPIVQHWLSRSLDPALIVDVQSEPLMSEESRMLLADLNLRAAAHLPLYTNGRWIGSIVFWWTEPHAFDERERRMYMALQQHAAAVAHSLRLFDQTQRRARELETAKWEMEIGYSASRELVQASSSGELLDAVSAYARERGAISAHLFYFDAYQPNWIEVVAEWASRDGGDLGIGWKLDISQRMLGRYWLASPQSPTLIPDIMTSPHVGDDSRMVLAPYSVRGFAVLPLNNKGRWIGVIYIFWDMPVSFDARDMRIFTALQQQAAAVIDSIRLLDETHKRQMELEAANQEIKLLYETSEAINGADSYQEVVEAVATFDPDADVVTLMLWENFDWETAEYLEVTVVIDRAGKGNIQAGAHLPKDSFPIAYQMIGERVWIFEDRLTDSRLDPVTRENWELLDIRSFMGPALYVNKCWIGGITFHSSKPRQYSAREARLLAGVGDLVVAAIERIRLRNETEAARRHAEALAEQAQKLASLEERTRLARELHDSISQVLYGIGISAQTAQTLYQTNPTRLPETLDYVVSLAEAGLTEMRALIFELRPESLEEEGLVTALKKQAASLQARHGIEMRTHFCEEPALPVDVKEGLYRIARETLHNIIKHAQATHVSLSFVSSGDAYHLQIADNGLGFDTREAFPGHLGLKSIRERTASLNGTVTIMSTPGEGTRIAVIIPHGRGEDPHDRSPNN